MKCSNSIIGTLAFGCFAMLISSGCGRTEKEQSNIEDQTGAKAATQAKPLAESSRSPESPLASSRTDSDDEIIRAVSKEILTARGSKDAAKANKLMGQFVAVWKPVGRRAADLRSQIGEPDERTANSLNYRLDTGYGGWIWTFKITDDKITAVSEQGMD